jgi:hypothetical protein
VITIDCSGPRPSKADTDEYLNNQRRHPADIPRCGQQKYHERHVGPAADLGSTTGSKPASGGWNNRLREQTTADPVRLVRC